MTLLAGSTATEQQDRSRVVCLLNMVTHDELLDNDEYEGMLLLHQMIHNDVDSFL